MASLNPQTVNNVALAFRLRASVRYYLLKENQPVLILFFPLKIVYIHSFWRPVLDIFTKGEFISFEELLALIPETPLEKVELFLKDMNNRIHYTNSSSVS